MSITTTNLKLIIFAAYLIFCLPIFAADIEALPEPNAPFYYEPSSTIFNSALYPPSPAPNSPPPEVKPAPYDKKGNVNKIGNNNQPKTIIASPTFSTVSQRCVRPGDIVNFNGNNLSKLSNYQLTLNINNTEIVLSQLHASDTQLIVRVPEHSELQAEQSYPISLINNDDLTHYPQTALSIHICALETTTQTLDHESGEILILADASLVTALKLEADILGLQLLESHELKALGDILLTLETTETNLQSAIATLRNKFPNANIDFNNHYQHAAKPRTYAREMIAWPSKQSCSNMTYQSITIGIIDGQPDLTHPALLNQNITVKNFLKESQQVDLQHGTAVTAILIGNQPELGFEGLLPNINIMAATALHRDKENLLATTQSIVRSLDWLMLQNIRLINISLAGSKANRILKKAFATAIQQNIIIFSAAGNGGKTASKSYPAALPGVIAITAIDAANRIYLQANQGKYIDFSAPGVDIWTTNKTHQGKYSSGTSYASPYALAIAAYYLKQNPALSPHLLYAAMQAGTQDLGENGYDTTFGWGLIHAPTKMCD